VKILGIDFYLRKRENGTREMARKELGETVPAVAGACTVVHKYA